MSSIRAKITRMNAGKIAEINVRFPITITAILLVVVVGLSVVFYLVTSSWRETLIFLAAATAAGATVGTAFYSARTLNIALQKEDKIRERESSLDTLARKQRAMAYAERFGEPGMHYLRDICRQVYDLRGSPPEAVQTFANNASNKTNVTNMLNFFEEMGFAIEAELVDTDLLRDQFCGVVTSVFQILRPWIEQERVNRGRPNIWIKVERLNGDWS